jgi:hypothetical protein
MRRFVDLIKLKRLDQMIRSKATGAPDDFAKHLGMSRSSLYEMLAFLKEEMKAPIIYDGYKPSYVYQYTPRFHLGFERLETIEKTGNYGSGIEKKKKKKKKIANDNDDFLLDIDIDFTDLYH